MMNPSRKPIAVAALCFATLLCGCAGDLGAAREVAGKAAAIAGDMQQTTLSAIDQQRVYHQSELNHATQLMAAAQENLASSSRHQSAWKAADLKDSQEIYEAVAGMMADSDLSKTTPFLMMAPPSEFSAPAIDRKAFMDLIAKFTKLSQALSPMDRANALKPFIAVVIKSFGDSVKSAKTNAAKPMAPTASPATASTLANPAGLSAALPVEALSDNSVLVEALTSELGQ